MTSIWDSLRLFQNNLIPLTTIILPFAVFLEIFDAFYLAQITSDELLIDDSIPLLLVHLSIQPFYSVALVFYLAAIISKQQITITKAWSLSISYWPRFLLLSLLLNLFVLTGLLLFVIPGIFLYIRFSFAEFYLILEQQQPITAIRNSLINTREHFLILFAGLLILVIFTYGPFLLIKEAINLDDHQVNILSIALNVIFDILAIIFTVFTFRIYHLSIEKQT